MRTWIREVLLFYLLAASSEENVLDTPCSFYSVSLGGFERLLRWEEW